MTAKSRPRTIRLSMAKEGFDMSEIEIMGVALTIGLIALGVWVYSWPSLKS